MLAIIIGLFFVLCFILGKLHERNIWKMNCNKTTHKDLLYRTVKGKPYFIFDFESFENAIGKVPVENPAFKDLKDK